MTVTDNQRPGVYSRYSISSAYTPPRSRSHAAVVARANGGETGRLYAFTSAQALAEIFSADSGNAVLRGCVQILLQSGVSRVYAVAVEDDFYEDALALIEDVAGIGAVVCDCSDAADYAALKASVERSSSAQRERVAYCGAGTSQGAIQAAGALNSERVVLCCPAVSPLGGAVSSPAYAAAAMAGEVLAQNDPAWNYSGEHLLTVHSPAAFAESEVQAMLAAGVTLLEQGDGAVECVRALTTRTKTGGVTDYSLRSLNAVLCIDDVMQAMRLALKATLHGSMLAGRTLQAVRSQAAVVLAERQDAGVIESYESPAAYSDESDPTICVVELSFRIAHVVSQIHIAAHIRV